eukprot:s5838_g3.t1
MPHDWKAEVLLASQTLSADCGGHFTLDFVLPRRFVVGITNCPLFFCALLVILFHVTSPCLSLWTELEVDAGVFESALSQLRPESFAEGSHGVVLLTRDMFAKAHKVRSTKALVVILPGGSNDDLKSLGLQDSAISVHWLLLKDPLLDRWQRKEVSLIQLSTTPCLPKSLDSEVAWQVEPTVEMTAVMSKRLFTSDAEWAQLLATSRSTVPATIFGLHSDLSSNVVSFYGWTKVSDSMQKVTFRLAAVHRDLVLAASGALLNFVVQELCRDAVARKERDTRTAVLWLRKTSHGDALVLLKRVSSHLGLALGNDGFGIRVAASALSDARKILFPSDSRFGTTNSQIRGALKYEIVGLPAGCSKNTIVERFAAWKNSSDEGWHVIPLQTWFSGGQTYWLVAADEAPPGHAYVMKNSRVLVRPAVSSNVAAPRCASLGRRVRFKHKQSIADPWAPIDAFLQGLQLYRSHVPGDGSCQFHAISTQSRFNHIELRRQALAYIRSHASEFADFITGDSMESYLSHMARRHTWGDHITLRALAMCLNQPIHVANRHGVTVVPTDAAHVDASPIWVAYNGVHYDAALPVQIQPALVAPHVPAEPLHHSRPSANCNFAQAPPSCPGLPLDSSASASPSVSPFGASGRTFPRPLPFAIASCNITSLKKNASLLEGFPDVIALQETRHTSLSPGALLSKLRLLGYSAIFGSPVVQRAPSRTGQARTIFNGRPGGVALAFKSHVPAQIVPVGKCELRQRLWQTGRWLHCVIGYGSSGRAIHVIVVYGYTGTYSHSTKSHSQNESFLSDVFLESSRRLDVPCIVLGDFNRQPQDSHACHQACVQGDWLDAAVAACRLDPTHFPANGLCRRLDAIFLSKVAAVTFHAYSVLDDTGIPSHRPVLVRLTLPAVHNVHTQLKRPRRFPPEALVPTPDTDQPFFQSCFASFAPIWESHLQSNNTTGMFLTLSSLAEAFLCSKANLQVNKRNCTLYCGYCAPSAGLKFTDIPNGLAALSKVPGAGWTQIFLFLGLVEKGLYTFDPTRQPGDYKNAGVLGVPNGSTMMPGEGRNRKLNSELANGRLAMMAIIGMFFQDGLTGSAWGDWAAYTDSPLRAFENELGVQAPVGYWDPMGMSKDGDEKTFRRRRESELKNGRVAMFAAMGFITPEYFRFPGFLSPTKGLKFADVPNGLAALSKAQLGHTQVTGRHALPVPPAGIITSLPGFPSSSSSSSSCSSSAPTLSSLFLFLFF